MSERIGLIGIGLVGTALAGNLRKAGFEVVGFDIDPARCEHLASIGGRPAEGPADVARRCRRVLLSLMTTEIVCQVVEGDGGLLSAEPPPQVLIDTTTGDPQQTTALSERLAARGVKYLDATISGSSRQIAARQGVFMVGGQRAAFDACRDLFAALSETFFHVGPSGSGAKSKLAVNLILGLNRLALAEGLVFAERLGLDPAAFLELLHHTAAGSAVARIKGPRMITGDFAPAGRLAQHRKDVALIVEYADTLSLELPACRTHLEVLDAAIAAGDGDLDNAAVIREIRRRGR